MSQIGRSAHRERDFGVLQPGETLKMNLKIGRDAHRERDFGVLQPGETLKKKLKLKELHTYLDRSTYR